MMTKKIFFKSHFTFYMMAPSKLISGCSVPKNELTLLLTLNRSETPSVMLIVNSAILGVRNFPFLRSGSYSVFVLTTTFLRNINGRPINREARASKVVSVEGQISATPLIDSHITSGKLPKSAFNLLCSNPLCGA